MPDWVTTEQAAEFSGYDIQHIRYLAREGRIGAVKRGTMWWVDRDRFRAYLDEMLTSEDGRAGPRDVRLQGVAAS